MFSTKEVMSGGMALRSVVGAARAAGLAVAVVRLTLGTDETALVRETGRWQSRIDGRKLRHVA